MKNTIFKLTEYVYYFSLLVLLILYLFPGSLIGYFLYGDLGQQPYLITNPIGTSINHLIFFSYITVLATIVRLRIKNIFTRVLKGHIAVSDYKLTNKTSGSIIDIKARKYLKKIGL